MALLAILHFNACKQATSAADKLILYTNGKIWTGDTANPIANSMVVQGNTLIFVGARTGSPDADSVVDLKGCMVVPGFIDNHTHFLSGGYQLSGVDLRKAKTPAEFISFLNAFIKADPGNSWILGGDWDHEAWGGVLPNRQWIDSITGDRPVLLSRYDGHMALANTAALQVAGIDRHTKEVAGGEIVRETNGEPTGVLKDEAMGLVYARIPEPTAAQLDGWLHLATAHAHRNGVTQVHDVGSYGGWTDLETYRRAHAAKKLDLRVYSLVPLSTWKKLETFVSQNGRGDDRLHWGGLKGFVDGSLGSTTAWFYKPYLDAPHTAGLVLNDTLELRQWILDADAAGLQVAVHAIGDRANDWLLNVYEEAGQRNGQRDRRFRIEHAQHLSEAAISRFAALDVVPSVQPYHAIDDGRWAAKRLDDDRLRRTYPFASLLQAGAPMTFGSDWTVGPLTPIEGIYAAVTRRTLDDNNPEGWYPEQKITVEQALTCYTRNNAYAGFHENKTGMLKAGLLADFVVLSHDLLTIPPEQIKDIQVLQTYLDGKKVFATGE